MTVSAKRSAALIFLVALVGVPAAAAPPAARPVWPASPAPSASPTAGGPQSLRTWKPAEAIASFLQEVQKRARGAQRVAKRVAAANVPSSGPFTTEIARAHDPNLIQRTASPAQLHAIAAWKTACDAGDPSAPPEIWKVSGTFGPDGQFTIDGACFGSSPTLEVLGEFPGGQLPVRLSSATRDSVRGSVAPIDGVYDQDVRVRVVRAGITSNEVRRPFVATKETQPGHITRGGCEPINERDVVQDVVMGCNLGGGTHYAHTTKCWGLPSINGRDSFSVVLPRGWSLDSVNYWSYAGYVDVHFLRADTFSVSWSATKLREDTGWNALDGSWCYDFYAANYTVSPTVVGPKGTYLK